MKKLLPPFFLFLTMLCQAQSNRYSEVTTSRFQPISYDELSNVAMTLQKRYDANQKYLYEMKKWILELKPQISEQSFITRLDKKYRVLTDIENGDLARATKYLKQTENAIREIISDYNIWVNNQNSKIVSSRNNNTANAVTNYAQMGFELQKQEKFADAIYNYSKFLDVNENNTDVLFLRAMCKSQLKDRYGAINDYDRIIELEKTAKPKVYKMSTVYNNKAYCLVELKQYEEALPFVVKALEMDKSEAYIWDTRGELFYHIGEYEKSVKDMDRALEIQKSANSYYFRALSYLKLNEKSKACFDLSRAGELGEIKAYEKISVYCN